MPVFAVTTRTRVGRLWWLFLEEKKWRKPGAFTVWAACHERMTMGPNLRQAKRIKLVMSHHIESVQKSVKCWKRKGRASVSWWTSLSPGTCLHWRMARRTPASSHPHLHNNGVKNKNYSSRKALCSWGYFFLFAFPGFPLMADFISDLTNTHSCVQNPSILEQRTTPKRTSDLKPTLLQGGFQIISLCNKFALRTDSLAQIQEKKWLRWWFVRQAGNDALWKCGCSLW